MPQARGSKHSCPLVSSVDLKRKLNNKSCFCYDIIGNEIYMQSWGFVLRSPLMKYMKEYYFANLVCIATKPCL